MGDSRTRRWIGGALFGVGLLALSACSRDGLRTGVYEGATANQRDRQAVEGRPPDEPAPTFDRYERFRTNQKH